jgi:hypothetical protein
MGRGTTQLNANSSCRMWHYNAIFAAPGETEAGRGRFVTSSTNVVFVRDVCEMDLDSFETAGS